MRKGQHHTKEWKEKMHHLFIRRKVSEETKKKMSIAQKGNKNCSGRVGNNGNGFPKGHGKYNNGSTGKHWKLSDETRKRQSAAQSGEKNGYWNDSMMQRQKRELKAGRKMSEQCEICGTFTKELKHGLYFDHDHATGKFRGWICWRCNLALGYVKDNTGTLEAMIKYLQRNVTQI